MTLHLPAIAILLPLLSAPICVAVRHALVTRLLTVAVGWGSLAVSGELLRQALSGAPIHYELGGFAPPLGIEYVIDTTTGYVLVIVSTIAAVVFSFGATTRGAALPAGREHLYYGAMLLCLAGLLGMTITGDAFNVFVFLEISSLSSYALIGLGQDRRAPVAAFSYLIMGTIGGTFFLLGIGFLYQATGTLNMADMAERLASLHRSRTVHVAFGFLTVGLSLKLAVFPLHQWLPNAYARAPAVISAFLSATATKVMYYVLVRMIFTIFGATFVFGKMGMDMALVPLSLGAMFVGSLAAIFQTDLKRLLAYSSVAQIGYMTLGLSFNSVNGLTGGLAHLFNHALMKGGLFLAVACLVYRVGSSRLDDLAGLGKCMPITSAAFVTGGLALIGVPATVGFISKWYLVLAALETGQYLFAGLILLSSLLAVAYVLRVVEVLYFKAPKSPDVREAPVSLLLPTWILIGATVVFGLRTELTAGLARSAAMQLLGAGS
ncbi:MAG: monovalent cation/H+ antiporter subunit D family protein [Myxococcales bacterium]|nr:monovalent cation/H+ antiporter subunit D family protein [Myxococcales bacterium]MDD9969912.1 monovalent cation/H+ antiporter subunit D family protein [Myxococcales bacterium]